MKKIADQKGYLPLILSAILIFSFYFAACEKNSSTNSGGPTSPSNYTVNLTASNTVVKAGGSTVLTVTVYKSNGELADGVAVNFAATAGSAPAAGATTNGRYVVSLSVTESTTITATVEDTSTQIRILAIK